MSKTQSWSISVLINARRLLFVLATSTIVGCMGGGGGGSNNNDTGDPTLQNQARVTGVVSGNGGLVDVNVSSGGKSAMTDVNGFYELGNIPIPTNGSIVLTYEKEGYATFQRSLPVADGETYAVAANLLQYHHNESMDAAQLNNLTIADPNNVTGSPLAEISFPAGSVASSGIVTVEVAVGDPTTETGRSTFPGDYMAASLLGGDVDTPLESVVFTEITITDANNTELTELNEPATVTIRLPDALQNQYLAGDTIAWWSYDETTATWVREDAEPATEVVDDALVIDLKGDGILYAQAKVTHFSWWNVDVPMDEHACFCVTVQDENADPVMGAQLRAEGVSYNGMSSLARTNANGEACVTVKRSTATTTERIKLYVESGGIKFNYNVTNASEGDVNSNEIFTPITQGSTIRNTGQCVNLENTIEQHFDGEVNGMVTKEGSGNPIANFTIFSNFGSTTITNASGQYSMNVPVGAPFSLFAVGLVSQEVTVASADTPEIINFIVPNRLPVLTQITQTPNGIITSGETVTLSVTATDADGDSLTYAWDTTAGSLNQTATTSVVWTAPASGSGTAEITVTVTDSNDGQTSQTAFIVYNETVSGGESLSFVILDTHSNDQPVGSVSVTLYNTDNKTIAQTITSGANGVVDFGDIGRDRATFSLVYEDVVTGKRSINTYVDVLVTQNIVYYLEELEQDEPTPFAGINLTLSNVPADANMMLSELEPMGSPLIALTNIPVTQDDLQDDSKLSMLANIYSGDLSSIFDKTLIGYGYLLDQTVTDGASYDISLSRSPINLGWATNPDIGLDWLTINGIRNGAFYNLYTNLRLGGTQSGILPFPSDFPVDNFLVTAFGSNSALDTTLTSIVRHNTLAQSLVITMPDYRIDSFEYSATTSTFNWAITGSAPRDIVSLDWLALPSNDGGKPISWSIMMSGNSTSWSLMELPAQVRTWVGTTLNLADIAEDSWMHVSVSDMSGVSNMDELWQLTTSGEPLLAGFQYVYSGVRWSEVDAGMESSINNMAQKSLQSTDTLPDSDRLLLPRGLKHLIRR